MYKQLTILLYHGVTASKSKGIENFSKKHLPVEAFRQQMKFISTHCNLVSLDDVVDGILGRKKLPECAVAVTFDDGFQNNYTVAAPILEEFKIPTTFYITSGMINTDLMFWVDELEACINACQKSYIELHLGENRHFSLKTNEDKINSLVEIKSYCKQQTTKIKDEVIQHLKETTNVTPSVDYAENYKLMTWKELIALNQSELFIIGGHSLYHNILSKVSSHSKLELDIQTSISLLAYNLNQKIKHYSYPEGQDIHYNNEVIRCLKKNGIVCAPSAIDGINTPGIDLFNLRRIMPGFMGRAFPKKELLQTSQV